MQNRRLSRRQVLGAAAALPVIGAVGCQSSQTGGGAQGQSRLPDYIPLQLSQPDIAAPEGGDAAWRTYPKDPERRFDAPVAPGAPITAMTYTWGAVAPGRDQNGTWQLIERQLGTQLNLEYVPQADYQARFSTVIAGGKLPDLVSVRPPQKSLPAMLKQVATDLSSKLSGNAVAAYPALANLPTSAWRGGAIGGGLYGVPVPRGLVGNVMFSRADVIKERGGTVTPTSFAEFSQTCKAVSDARAGRWAIGDLQVMDWVLSTYGIGSAWVREDGKLRHAVTLPQYEAALANMITLREAGYIHPDAAASTNTQRNDWFKAKTVAMLVASFGGWTSFAEWSKDGDGFEFAGIAPPNHDANSTAKHMRSALAADSFSILAKTDDEARIDQVLKVLDWIASPFGTAEFLDRVYGPDGTAYTLKGSDPIRTEQGKLWNIPVGNLTMPPGYIYMPAAPDQTEPRSNYQAQALKILAESPIEGRYSDTANGDGVAWERTFATLRFDVINGRETMETWKAKVSEWQESVGNKIAEEYEASTPAE